MPDIGSTLRETRMRKRIDIVEVESHTKIRSKYLRALENEEWDLLPGTTFVKTFLRTYADYLGLDSKMLVEEYKQRYERPAAQDLLPFAPRAAGRRQRRAAALSPLAVLAVIFVLLVAALWLLGQFGGDDPEPLPADRDAAPSATASPASGGSAARRVRLRIVATGPVRVCLVSASSGRVLIRDRRLRAGTTTRAYGAARLRVAFSNGRARMRVGDRTYGVADGGPVAYDLRPGRSPRRLAASARPSCA